MQTDQLIWLIAGGTAVLALLFLIRLFRMPQDDGLAYPSMAAEKLLPSPIFLPGEVPYGVDKRPMPTGEDLDVLLPAQVGPFVRASLGEPKNVHRDPIYAEYRSNGAKVFVELGVCDTASGSQRAITTAKAETDAEFPNIPYRSLLGAEPSYLRTVNKLGAFFAWTRGGYYFSAHAKKGEAVLDAFIQAFPY